MFELPSRRLHSAIGGDGDGVGDGGDGDVDERNGPNNGIN